METEKGEKNIDELIDEVLGTTGKFSEEPETEEVESTSGGHQQVSGNVIRVFCSKCNREVQADENSFTISKRGVVTLRCPVGKHHTILRKEDAERVKAWLGWSPVSAEKKEKEEVTEPEVEEYEEEEIDYNKILLEIIENASGLDKSIKEQFRDLVETYPHTIFTPALVQNILINLGASYKVATRIANQYYIKILKHQTKMQREATLQQMLGAAPTITPQQQQPQPPVYQAPFMLPPQQPTPFMQPPMFPLPQQPQPQQPASPFGFTQPQYPYSQQPQLQPSGPYQQPSPYFQYQQPQQQVDQPKRRVREEPEEDEIEVIEELDGEGNVKRRIIKQPRATRNELDILEIVKKLDPLDTLTKLSQAGILKARDDKEILDAISSLAENFREGMKELADKMSGSITSAIAAVAREQAPPASEEDEKIKELKEHLAKQEELIKELQKQVIEEKHRRELEELKSAFESKLEEIKELYNKKLDDQRKDYESLLREKEALISDLKDKLSSLETELKAKKLEGTPTEVQVMHVRKEALDKVTSDLKSLAESFGKDVVSPVLSGLVDVWRSQNIMNLALMEQAGQLPPGTIRRILEQRPVTKEEVERAKEKISMLKQLKDSRSSEKTEEKEKEGGKA